MDITTLISNILQTVLGTIICTLIVLCAKNIVEGNLKFHLMLKAFKAKLPPKHKIAKHVGQNSIGFNLVDLSSFKSFITERDADAFCKELEDFNYDSIYFKRKQIEGYSKNLRRLLSSGNMKVSIAMVQQVLEDEEHRSKLYIVGSRIGKRYNF